MVAPVPVRTSDHFDALEDAFEDYPREVLPGCQAHPVIRQEQAAVQSARQALQAPSLTSKSTLSLHLRRNHSLMTQTPPPKKNNCVQGHSGKVFGRKPLESLLFTTDCPKSIDQDLVIKLFAKSLLGGDLLVSETPLLLETNEIPFLFTLVNDPQIF